MQEETSRPRQAFLRFWPRYFYLWGAEGSRHGGPERRCRSLQAPIQAAALQAGGGEAGLGRDRAETGKGTDKPSEKIQSGTEGRRCWGTSSCNPRAACGWRFGRLLRLLCRAEAGRGIPALIPTPEGETRTIRPLGRHGASGWILNATLPVGNSDVRRVANGFVQAAAAASSGFREGAQGGRDVEGSLEQPTKKLHVVCYCAAADPRTLCQRGEGFRLRGTEFLPVPKLQMRPAPPRRRSPRLWLVDCRLGPMSAGNAIRYSAGQLDGL